MLVASPASAAQFTVSPVRIYLDSGKKIETITITNASEEELTLQVSTFEWSQDAQAKDVYTPTNDIVVFPKMISIKGGEELVLRVGTKVPPDKKEKTYRMFLDEIPKPGAGGEGATVRTLMKVGVPVFMAPAKSGAKGEAGEPGAAGEIVEPGLSGGVLRFRLKNDGNVHLMVRSIKIEGADAKGSTVFKKDMAGWYLLSGSVREYSVELPKEDCLKIEGLKIGVDSDKLSMERTLSVLPAMCR